MRFTQYFKYTVYCSTIALTAFLGVVPEARSDVMNMTPETDWSVSRVGGDIPYCTVARQYSGNIVLSFAENANGSLAIGFDFQDEKLNPQTIYEVGIETAAGAGALFNVNPVGPTAFIVRLEDDSVLRNQIWTTSNVKITVNDEIYQIVAEGFDESKKELQSCLSSFELDQAADAEDVEQADTTLEIEPESSVKMVPTPGAPIIEATQVKDKDGKAMTIIVPESMRDVLKRANLGASSTVTSLSADSDADEEAGEVATETSDSVQSTNELGEEENITTPEQEAQIEAEIEEDISERESDAEVRSPEEEAQEIIEDTSEDLTEEISEVEESVESIVEEAQDNLIEEEPVDITADVYTNSQEEPLDEQALEDQFVSDALEEDEPEFSSTPLNQQSGDNSSMKLQTPPQAPIEDQTMEDDSLADDLLEGGNAELLDELRNENRTLVERIAQLEAADMNNVTSVQDAQQRAEQLIKENDELKQQLANLADSAPDGDVLEGAPSSQQVQALEKELEFYKSEKERLSASLEELSLMAGDKMDMQAALRRQIMELEELLEKTASDKAAAEIELASLRADLNKNNMAATPDLQKAAAEAKYLEAQREIRRLAMLMEEQELKFEQEKKELEDMLFDPALTEENQRAHLAKLEQELKVANQALEEQRKLYEDQLQSLKNNAGIQTSSSSALVLPELSLSSEFSSPEKKKTIIRK